MDDQKITTQEVVSGISGFQYDKLIEQFGVKKINDDLIQRFEQVTGKKVHIWITRGIFFAHRELEEILNDYEQGKEIFLYTGRGPSSEALHLGHMVPFIFTKWLQDVFNAILIIQIADDEKFYFNDMNFKEIYKLRFENAKDIIACGFNPDRTFIFSNRDNSNLGQYVWPIYQNSVAFSNFFEPIFGVDNKIRCLVTYTIDQDPYFSLCRDIANQLNLYKPCAIISQFLPSLDGKSKMSSTNNSTEPSKTIFMSDSLENINFIIKKYAFSGGRQTKKEQELYGANLEIDIAYQYLRYFEFDDTILNKIAVDYSSGKMMSYEIKNILINKLNNIIMTHQEKRNLVTEEDIKYFYDLTKFTS